MSEPDHHSIEIEVTTGDVDVVLDRIWLCEPMAVGEQDVAGGVRFTVGFADRASAGRAMDHLVAWQPRLQAVAADEWVSIWRQGATPQIIGPFSVRLPEHHAAQGSIDLEIEPGVTFGFSHPSTLLALELMSRLELGGQSVLDIGSGSGVLAVAAALLGAETVEAVDVDPAAVTATTDNARRNDVTVTVRLGSVDVAQDAPVDLIVANLTAGTQHVVLPALDGRLGPQTTTILSGLLDGQESVAALLEGHDIVDVARLDGWIAVRLAASSNDAPCP